MAGGQKKHGRIVDRVGEPPLIEGFSSLSVCHRHAKGDGKHELKPGEPVQPLRQSRAPTCKFFVDGRPGGNLVFNEARRDENEKAEAGYLERAPYALPQRRTGICHQCGGQMMGRAGHSRLPHEYFADNHRLNDPKYDEKPCSHKRRLAVPARADETTRRVNYPLLCIRRHALSPNIQE